MSLSNSDMNLIYNLKCKNKFPLVINELKAALDKNILALLGVKLKFDFFSKDDKDNVSKFGITIFNPIKIEICDKEFCELQITELYGLNETKTLISNAINVKIIPITAEERIFRITYKFKIPTTADYTQLSKAIEKIREEPFDFTPRLVEPDPESYPTSLGNLGFEVSQ